MPSELQPISDEVIEDGRQLRLVRDNPDAWAAIERVAKQLRDDALMKFGESDNLNKDWWRGAESVAQQIMPALEARIEAYVQSVEQAKDAQEQMASRAMDGVGSGDLALV